jgi:hypothetical protein
MRLIKKSVVAAGFAGLVTAMVTLAAPPAQAHAEGAHAPRGVTHHDRGSLSQTAGETANPKVPEPRASVFPCDLFTHVCVKNNKSETKWIADHTSSLSSGGIGGASALCSKIPLPFPVKVACIITVSAAGGALADSYNGAAAKGQCVELHLTLPPQLILTHWKTEGC